MKLRALAWLPVYWRGDFIVPWSCLRDRHLLLLCKEAQSAGLVKRNHDVEQGELLGWSQGSLCVEAFAYFSGDNKQSLLNNQLIM